jgi:hypothetical protein
MKALAPSRLPIAALVLLVTTTLCRPGLQQASAVPPPRSERTALRTELAHAVVRLPSHGASATIIETRKGRTLLLGCGHAFAGLDRQKPIVLDIPTTRPTGTPQKKGVRLLAVDYDLDLSLVVLDSGPLEFVAPVACPGHTPGPHLLSVGYDEMRWPALERTAHVATLTSTTIFTWERPGHGRSGGALLDLDAGCLIGVVLGYEVMGLQRGMYVSHEAIQSFLARQRHEGRDWGLKYGDLGSPVPRWQVPIPRLRDRSPEFRPVPCPT